MQLASIEFPPDRPHAWRLDFAGMHPATFSAFALLAVPRFLVFVVPLRVTV